MRLIDADELIKEHPEVCSLKMKFNLDLAPTVDVAPVVRCRECDYFDQSSQECYRPNYTEAGSCYAEPDGGCSYGRKDGESL